VFTLKRILALIIFSLMLVGCGQKSEEEFVSVSSDLYEQMMIDGEQSEEVNELYNQLVDDYKEYSDDELYKELTGMYEALSNDEAASGKQTEVMRILNKR
jgi:hypothetical protein